MKSLQANRHTLASATQQLQVLEESPKGKRFIPFRDKLDVVGFFPLRPTGIDIFQVNVGKMCNQACKHCHVDAAPDRKEIMTRETMEQCLSVLSQYPVATVDITGELPR